MYQMRGPPTEPRKRRTKTYWDKYPQLRLLRALGKRRLISFMFFSYVFIYSSAEFTDTMKKNHTLSGQSFVTGFIFFSAFLFDHGINSCQPIFLVPFMSLTVSALTLFIVLSGHMVRAIIEVPSDQHLYFAFHIYIFVITTAVSLIYAKGMDVMWQAYGILGDLHKHDLGTIERLITNAPWVEESGPDQRRRRRNNGVQRIHIERARR